MSTIRELNDQARTTFEGVRVMATCGINALTEAERQAVCIAVREFDKFTPDNDPYCEHDFGNFTTDNGNRIFWKFDYYDLKMEYASPDPSDPSVTARVLTIMLAEEY